MVHQEEHFAAIVRALSDALSDPATYPERPEAVEVIETHVSAVFLAGRSAYKVKKPLALPFLDFSTLDRREHYCREEIRLNAELAPGVYRAVVPIRRKDGRLHLGGEAGDIVDWAVEMERLPAQHMFDHMLAHGRIDNEMLQQIAATLVRFHARAATGEGVDVHGSPAAVRALVEENFAETDRFVRAGSLHALARDVHDFVEAWALHFLNDRAERFAQRERMGRIREGHGDLHAGNICFRPEGLVIYDRIEFSARFRCADVAADLAFLLMDLDHRGYRGFSDYLLREYVARSEDAELIELVDFYKCYRAWVRGKVHALRAAQVRGDAREEARLTAMRYFNLAAGYTLPASLVLTCGLPGTGKSTAAARLAEAIDCQVLNSDTVRKQLAGVPPGERRASAFGTGLYDAEHTKATYGALLEQAGALLDRGRSVLVDAGFRDGAQRAPFLAMARERRVPVVVLHVDPPDALVRERLAARERSGTGTSDAGVDVYERCKATFTPPVAEEGAPVVRWADGESGPEMVATVLGALLAQNELSVEAEEG